MKKERQRLRAVCEAGDGEGPEGRLATEDDVDKLCTKLEGDALQV